MLSFYGTETFAIDHKGRLSIPAAMRRARSGRAAIGTFVLVKSFEGCLALYTEEQWEPVEERLRRLPFGGPKARAFTRAFLLNACRVTVDAQGRITIPSALIGRAELGKEAVLLGQVGYIEIWNPQRLASLVRENEQNIEPLAAELLGGN